jgi:hypothetical protein
MLTVLTHCCCQQASRTPSRSNGPRPSSAQRSESHHNGLLSHAMRSDSNRSFAVRTPNALQNGEKYRFTASGSSSDDGDHSQQQQQQRPQLTRVRFECPALLLADNLEYQPNLAGSVNSKTVVRMFISYCYSLAVLSRVKSVMMHHCAI